VTFDFITDQRFRASLEGDYRELQIALANGIWKTVYVLAGSIIEAVLADYLTGTGQTNPDPLKMTLGDLIAACKKAGVLSDRTANLSSAVQGYRNLIHPGRLVRSGEAVDQEGAQIARSLVEIIVREISAKQRQVHGYTAEQLVTKFERDPSATTISKHILDDARPAEVERLLLEVLPERYLAYLQEDVRDPQVERALASLYRAGFDSASVDVKKKVARRFVSILKEESEQRVLVHEDQFFRITDLKFVDKKDEKLVKEHLLGRLSHKPTSALLNVIDGWGSVADEADVRNWVDGLVRLAVTDRREAARARSLLEDASWATASKLDPMIVSRLDNWADAFDRRGQLEQATTVREIKEKLLLEHDSVLAAIRTQARGPRCSRAKAWMFGLQTPSTAPRAARRTSSPSSAAAAISSREALRGQLYVPFWWRTSPTSSRPKRGPPWVSEGIPSAGFLHPPQRGAATSSRRLPACRLATSWPAT
jgi:hypothetical protein